jgi:hypothetical protein
MKMKIPQLLPNAEPGTAAMLCETPVAFAEGNLAAVGKLPIAAQ